jgi:hypothetical protein
LARALEVAHDRIGVEDRGPEIAKHRRDRRFSRAHRPGEADHERGHAKVSIDVPRT